MKLLLALFFAATTFSLSAVAAPSPDVKARKPVRVVTSLTDLAWAVKEIGGARVDVSPLLKGTENPHYVDTVPDFIRLVSEAEVVCVVGLELEIGWIPKVLARSGNAQVQPGGKGFCETGKAISVLEKPTGPVDRSMGDVHPAGNPHFWLSPLRLADATSVIAETLSNVDPEGASAYAAGALRLKKKLVALAEAGRKKIAQKKPGALMEYHREFAYLLDTYGLKSLGSVEEKPGVAPSAGRLAEAATGAKAAGVKLVLAGNYAPKQALERFKELSGATVLQTTTAIAPDGDYVKFHEALVDSIVRAL